VAYHCRYVAKQIAIKTKYTLWETRARRVLTQPRAVSTPLPAPDDEPDREAARANGTRARVLRDHTPDAA